MKVTQSVVAAVALLLGHSVPAYAQTIATLGASGEPTALVNATGQEAPGLQLIGGFGRIDFSRGEDYPYFLETADSGYLGGAVAALNIFTLLRPLPGSLSGTSGASVVRQMQEDIYGSYIPHAISWQSPSATSVSLVKDGINAGQLQTLALQGGLALSVPRSAGIATGGSFQMDNMRVDLSAGQVIADLTGTRSALGTRPAVAFSSPNTVMWTFGAVTGPTQIPPDALLGTSPVTALAEAGLTVIDPRVVTTYTPGGTCVGFNGYHYLYSCPIEVTTDGFTAVRADIQLDSLELTSAGATFMTNSLGLQAVSTDVLRSVNTASNQEKWGSLTVGVFFRAVDRAGDLPAIPASIPEPSTYMLMGLGLVGVVALTKRHHAQRNLC